MVSDGVNDAVGVVVDDNELVGVLVRVGEFEIVGV